MKRLVQVCIICMVSFVLMGCSSELIAIKDTLTAFQNAYEQEDIDRMLDCVEPDVAEKIRWSMTLFDFASDSDVSDVMKEILGAMTSDIDESMKISVSKIDIDGNKASVHCKLKSKEKTKKLIIYMKKIEDKWYISDYEIE